MMKKVIVISLCILLTSCTSRFNESLDHIKNTVSDDRYVGTTHPSGYFIDKKYHIICYTLNRREGVGVGCANIEVINEQ